MSVLLENPAVRVPAVRLDGIRKSFAIGRERLQALDGIDLEVMPGETVALVGESGCGKSTLARILMLLERPDEGTIQVNGLDPSRLGRRELHSWRRKIQMVFQDPFGSLNPRMTAAQLIAEPWRSHSDAVPSGMRAARIRELLDLVGLRTTDGDRYPQEFSGGQRQRIGIARALALGAEVLVLDEPVSALDLSVQAQVINLLDEIQARLGVAYLFISHDLSVVRHVADRVAVMYLGRIVESGPAAQVLTTPRHPYTAALVSAAPSLDGAGHGERIVLAGDLPSPVDPPSGCTFRTRCWLATDECAGQRPEIVHDDGHGVRCLHPLC